MFWVLFLLLLLKTVIYDMTTREWLLFSANSTIFQLYHGGPTKIEINMIFWRKIVIFHTKYPKYFRASLCSAQFF
jgi:hypothetical protein